MAQPPWEFSAIGYAFSLSAPVILEGATHLDPTRIGLIVAGGGLLGAVAMLVNGWSSDKSRERHWHTAVPLFAMALGYLVIGAATSPVVLIVAYLATAIGASAVQGSFWGIPSDALRGRSAAVGVAMIGSIGMLGSFIGPWAFGVARDHTGGHTGVGVVSLSVRRASSCRSGSRFGVASWRIGSKGPRTRAGNRAVVIWAALFRANAAIVVRPSNLWGITPPFDLQLLLHSGHRRPYGSIQNP